MSLQIEGTVKLIQEPQTFASGFAKRGFVVTVPHEKYPQDIAFECFKDKIEQLDDLREGDEVKVSFTIQGREYNDRYYNTLVCWSVRRTGAEVVNGPDEGEKPSEGDSGGSVDDDSIPF